MNELENAASLMGKKGGKKTLKNKGKKHFSEMGKKSAEAKKALKLANSEGEVIPLTTSDSCDILST